MRPVREITVFTLGDANDLKAWSNVPYFFARSLEEKGIRVNRVNIEENTLLFRIYKYTAFSLLKLLKRNSDHNYFRSGLNHFLTNRKIRKAVHTYPDTDVFLFLTYSFSTKRFSSKKTVLFSDWGYLYFIKHFLGREPAWFERAALRREARNLTDADLVLGLFPKSNEFNRLHFPDSRSFYLGNVINSPAAPDREQILRLKSKSRKIIFIGNKKYLKGAQALVQAFGMLPVTTTPYELHLIGLTSTEPGLNKERVFCHGYLDKGLDAENQLYYSLLSEARLIVNTSGNWGAFSAMTEAMYYFTPVITRPYTEFTETYGNDISFGCYVTGDSPAELSNAIRQLLESKEEDVIHMMMQAHEKVKDFTWSNYTNRFLELLAT